MEKISLEQQILDLEQRIDGIRAAYASLIKENERLQKIVNNIDLISWGIVDEKGEQE